MSDSSWYEEPQYPDNEENEIVAVDATGVGRNAFGRISPFASKSERSMQRADRSKAIDEGLAIAAESDRRMNEPESIPVVQYDRSKRLASYEGLNAIPTVAEGMVASAWAGTARNLAGAAELATKIPGVDSVMRKLAGVSAEFAGDRARRFGQQAIELLTEYQYQHGGDLHPVYNMIETSAAPAALSIAVAAVGSPVVAGGYLLGAGGAKGYDEYQRVIESGMDETEAKGYAFSKGLTTMAAEAVGYGLMVKSLSAAKNAMLAGFTSEATENIAESVFDAGIDFGFGQKKFNTQDEIRNEFYSGAISTVVSGMLGGAAGAGVHLVQRRRLIDGVLEANQIAQAKEQPLPFPEAGTTPKEASIAVDAFLNRMARQASQAWEVRVNPLDADIEASTKLTTKPPVDIIAPAQTPFDYMTKTKAAFRAAEKEIAQIATNIDLEPAKYRASLDAQVDTVAKSKEKYDLATRAFNSIEDENLEVTRQVDAAEREYARELANLTAMRTIGKADIATAEDDGVVIGTMDNTPLRMRADAFERVVQRVNAKLAKTAIAELRAVQRIALREGAKATKLAQKRLIQDTRRVNKILKESLIRAGMPENEARLVAAKAVNPNMTYKEFLAKKDDFRNALNTLVREFEQRQAKELVDLSISEAKEAVRAKQIFVDPERAHASQAVMLIDDLARGKTVSVEDINKQAGKYAPIVLKTQAYLTGSEKTPSISARRAKYEPRAGFVRYFRGASEDLSTVTGLAKGRPATTDLEKAKQYGDVIYFIDLPIGLGRLQDYDPDNGVLPPSVMDVVGQFQRYDPREQVRVSLTTPELDLLAEEVHKVTRIARKQLADVKTAFKDMILDRAVIATTAAQQRLNLVEGKTGDLTHQLMARLLRTGASYKTWQAFFESIGGTELARMLDAEPANREREIKLRQFNAQLGDVIKQALGRDMTDRELATYFDEAESQVVATYSPKSDVSGRDTSGTKSYATTSQSREPVRLSVSTVQYVFQHMVDETGAVSKEGYDDVRRAMGMAASEIERIFGIDSDLKWHTTLSGYPNAVPMGNVKQPEMANEDMVIAIESRKIYDELYAYVAPGYNSRNFQPLGYRKNYHPQAIDSSREAEWVEDLTSAAKDPVNIDMRTVSAKGETISREDAVEAGQMLGDLTVGGEGPFASVDKRAFLERQTHGRPLKLLSNYVTLKTAIRDMTHYAAFAELETVLRHLSGINPDQSELGIRVPKTLSDVYRKHPPVLNALRHFLETIQTDSLSGTQTVKLNSRESSFMTLFAIGRILFPMTAMKQLLSPILVLTETGGDLAGFGTASGRAVQAMLQLARGEEITDPVMRRFIKEDGSAFFTMRTSDYGKMSTELARLNEQYLDLRGEGAEFKLDAKTLSMLTWMIRRMDGFSTALSFSALYDSYIKQGKSSAQATDDALRFINATHQSGDFTQNPAVARGTSVPDRMTSLFMQSGFQAYSLLSSKLNAIIEADTDDEVRKALTQFIATAFLTVLMTPYLEQLMTTGNLDPRDERIAWTKFFGAWGWHGQLMKLGIDAAILKIRDNEATAYDMLKFTERTQSTMPEQLVADALRTFQSMAKVLDEGALVNLVQDGELNPEAATALADAITDMSRIAPTAAAGLTLSSRLAAAASPAIHGAMFAPWAGAGVHALSEVLDNQYSPQERLGYTMRAMLGMSPKTLERLKEKEAE